MIMWTLLQLSIQLVLIHEMLSKIITLQQVRKQ